MAIKKEYKVWLHGRLRMLFDKQKNKRGVTTASLMREIINYYFENHPDAKP